MISFDYTEREILFALGVVETNHQCFLPLFLAFN